MSPSDVIEHKGYWWLADTPADRVAGTLTYSIKEGIALALIGDLRVQRKFVDIVDGPITIVGVDESGSRITVLGAREVNVHGGVFGSRFTSVRYAADTVVVGQHLTNMADLPLESISVRVAHLDDWIRDSGIVHRIEAEKGKPARKYTASFEFPDEYPVDAREFSCRFGVMFHWSPGLSGELLWRVRRTVDVKPNEPMLLSDLIRGPIAQIRTLVAFATATPVAVLEIWGVLPPDLGPEQQTLRARIHSSRVQGPPERSVYDAHRALLPFSKIKDAWGTMLNAWIDGYDQLSPSFDSYFAALYADRMYEDDRFLMFTRALEVYHRRRVPGAYLAPNRFEQLRRALVETLEATLTEDERGAAPALTAKLTHFNEYSLRQRLTDVLASLDGIANVLIADRKAFVSKVVDTRNYLTHYDAGSRTGRPTVIELYKLSECLKFVLEVLLLLELGIERERVSDIVSRHDAYGQFKRHVLDA